MNILSIIQSLTPVEAILLSIVAIYGIYKGIIIIPWLNIKNDKKKNPHLKCKYYSDLNKLIQKEVERFSKIHELKKYLIDEQMSSSDKSMINIKNILMDKYKTINPNGRDLRAYSKILDYTLSKTKTNKLKPYIVGNHFCDKNEVEFTLYKQTTTRTLMSYHIMCLDEEYYSDDFAMNRQDLMELDEDIMNDIRDEIYRLFDDIRAIAHRYSQELKKT